MRLYERLSIEKNLMDNFCQQWKLAQLAVFGSVLRDDFKADSDIDFLVALNDDFQLNFSDFLALEDQLKNLLKRDVDIIFQKDLDRSENWIRRQHIFETAEVIYES